MKAILGLAALLSGLAVAAAVTPARADADSDAWIKQCAGGSIRLSRASQAGWSTPPRPEGEGTSLRIRRG